MYKHIRCRSQGRRSPSSRIFPEVPDQPIIPFIEGDGTGADICR
jgi:isocitrate dehydrogenase